MNTKYIIGILSVAVVALFVWHLATPASPNESEIAAFVKSEVKQATSNLGSVVGPDSFFPIETHNGVKRYYEARSFAGYTGAALLGSTAVGSTTVCTIVSPREATTSVVHLGLNVNSATIIGSSAYELASIGAGIFGEGTTTGAGGGTSTPLAIDYFVNSIALVATNTAGTVGSSLTQPNSMRQGLIAASTTIKYKILNTSSATGTCSAIFNGL